MLVIFNANTNQVVANIDQLANRDTKELVRAVTSSGLKAFTTFVHPDYKTHCFHECKGTENEEVHAFLRAIDGDTQDKLWNIKKFDTEKFNREYRVKYAGADMQDEEGSLVGGISYFADADEAFRCRTFVKKIVSTSPKKEDFLGKPFRFATHEEVKKFKDATL